MRFVAAAIHCRNENTHGTHTDQIAGLQERVVNPLKTYHVVSPTLVFQAGNVKKPALFRAGFDKVSRCYMT